MEAIVKRAIFRDAHFSPPASPQWAVAVRASRFLALYLPVDYAPKHEFINYAIGFRFQASQREFQLIEANHLMGQAALQLAPEVPAVTFADLLAQKLLVEVRQSPEALLRVESRVRQAAAMWTHFFESMVGGA